MPTADDQSSTEFFAAKGGNNGVSQNVALPVPAETCATISFDGFSHGDLVTELDVPLFGGFTLSVDVISGGPASANEEARIFFTNRSEGIPDPDLHSADATDGFAGDCADCMPLGNFLVISNLDFAADGDSPSGGEVVLTGFPVLGQTVIRSYTAVDQDITPIPETLALEIDGVQTGISTSPGDGSVEVVTPATTPAITTSASLVFSGSGAVDDLVICHTPPPGTGTGTIGYWKTHPEAWPIDQITIGGVVYDKADAIEIMEAPGRGDKSFDLFSQLVAAKLNVLSGNESSCVNTAIMDADDFLAMNTLGSDVRANSDAWQNVGSALHSTLTDYNEGKLCAPSRD